METILENVPTETDPEIDSLLIFNHNDPISEMHEANSEKAMAKTTASKDGHVRRNSTGNIGIPYKSVKILSRYLATTTTSSCHDQCKYGIRQDLDPNTFGSPTLKTIAEKHIGKKKSGVGFPPSSPRSPKPDSPVSSPRGNLFKKFSVPLKGLVPRSKSTLSKLSVSSNEDHSGGKESGTRVRYIDVLATPRARKQTVRNVKEEKTSKSNSPSSNLHSVKKDLTRPAVSLDSKQVGKKSTSLRTDKPKSLNTVDKAENQLPSNSTSQEQDTNMEKRSMDAETEKKIKPKRDRIVKEKDQELAARKLNFRRGKVTENNPADAPPRRLKFKQRSLSDTLVIDVEKIENNLKSREVVTDDLKSREVVTDDAEIDGANPESEKVALKHQEGDQDKKGPQNLLNNVIEETANKLAETKKSKVKVLVGAFESVISLQDAKPAASAVDAC